MNPLKKALKLIQSFEGLPDGNPKTVKLDPYLDPVGIWTIGWGHAMRDAEGNFLRGEANRQAATEMYPDGITRREALTLLRDDVRSVVFAIRKAVTTKINENQMAALISFTFNVGIGNLKSSTLLKHVNQGEFGSAAKEFAKWNKSGGKVLKGLIRRRKAESELFSQQM